MRILILPLLLAASLSSCGPLGGPTDSDNNSMGPGLSEVGVWEGGERPVKLSLGESFSCALYDKGGVRCWGANRAGELGVRPSFDNGARVDGGLDERFEAAMVPALGSGVVDLELGRKFACALLENKEVHCWGSNLNRELGISEQGGFSVAPQRVPGLGQVEKLSVGTTHSCALNAEGEVICWGNNSTAQLGQGEGSATGQLDGSSERPLIVPGLSGTPVDVRALGAFSCALMGDGAVYCWGFDSAKIMGLPPTYLVFGRGFAQLVPGLHEGVTELASGGSGHLCAIRNDEPWCYGINSSGELANGDDDTRHFATPIEDFELPGAVTSVASGQSFTCVLVEDGSVWCAGRNREGQLGDGSRDKSAFFVKTDLSEPAQHVAAGINHACAILSSGSIACWGENNVGQVGTDEGANFVETPVAVAVREDPSDFGGPAPELVSATDDYTPPRLEEPDPLVWVGGTRVVSLSGYGDHTCALYDAGGARCWGFQNDRRLGFEARANVRIAQNVPKLTGASMLGTGERHSCFIRDDGKVACWGSNISNQLGRAMPNETSESLLVPGLPDEASSIAVGRNHTCISAGDGASVHCWGRNNSGQLGNGSTDSSVEGVIGPVEVSGLDGAVSQLALGSEVSCARLSDGRVQCWGQRRFGNLSGEDLAPTDIEELGSNNVWLSLGNRHGCALDDQGEAWCWGKNEAGQLGRGNTDSDSTVAPVAGLPAAVASIEAGTSFTCALLVDDTVWCVGENMGDPTVNGAASRATDWTQIELPGAPEQLMAGNEHACARLAEDVYCWGVNLDGQLGDASDVSSATPVRVLGL